MRLTLVLCSKYFKRYIDRELHKGRMRRQWHPLTGWKEKKKEKFYPNEHRPWTAGYLADNPVNKKVIPPLFVEPLKEWSIFHGDRVSTFKLEQVSALIMAIHYYGNYGNLCYYQIVASQVTSQVEMCHFFSEISWIISTPI